ncbi:HlyD family efflux transporter periplasmic adaptor subunit [Nodularia spumigena]|jgi:HlyD family secretion protein|uniref:HlyD family efflux transporter periplasmic adaptor subunit n=1 Tax=Nodularia spumigena UHCC 0060 TaxID=3110300 RepID=A0ABU5UVH6_NODSP|nr:HlyD family efflux transporter periplasmic adaptor subunit [Nodularia spumigena]MEA5527599.1 HlyD family efflux transporter periplasmic adaptor subunit [Nodularia spumigena UHCC 0143]MEA5558927.1 HlyD family efflux transporter periplasmic adaptor subunit [Nodularia spumigena CH309]MEA5610309.1 HlyD family efflux transporter periplasmic adaptor subunit [Nodularia spumigena UHCC 0060]MEA5613004.1 HlyD family efflux transporter periplasmic adaptor subunit [Nodularia spumigena UHCC 0040]
MSRVTEKPRSKELLLDPEQPKIWWGIAVALPIVIAAGLLTTAKVEQLKKIGMPVPVKPLTNSISAVGRLEPKGEVLQLSAPAAGLQSSSRVQKIFVSEGERVKKGQMVAILDNHDTQLAIVEEAKARLQEARANLAQVKLGSPRDIEAQTAVIARLQAQLNGERDAQQATIARIAAQLSGEKLALQATVNRLEAELRGQKDSLKATIARIQAEQRNAQVDAGRYDMLYREGAISQQERDRRRLSAVTFNQQVIESQATLQQVQATLRQQLAEARANQVKTLATLQQQLVEARVNRDKTMMTLQSQINEEQARLSRIKEFRPTDIQRGEAQVSNAIANVKRAEAELKLSYVQAPIAGEILAVHTQSGEAISTNGIAEIGETNQMTVIAEVPEDTIAQVRIGQTATITSENGAFIGELNGTVTEIGRKIGKKDVLSTDPVADVDARVVEVKIALLPEDSQRVSGFTNAKVLTQINKESNSD